VSKVNVEINGKIIEAEQGQMIIEVADANNIRIPRFCYHKHLSVAANCRMCLVEVEKLRKPVPACATPITDGMKIMTRSPEALKAQYPFIESIRENFENIMRQESDEKTIKLIKNNPVIIEAFIQFMRTMIDEMAPQGMRPFRLNDFDFRDRYTIVLLLGVFPIIRDTATCLKLFNTLSEKSKVNVLQSLLERYGTILDSNNIQNIQFLKELLKQIQETNPQLKDAVKNNNLIQQQIASAFEFNIAINAEILNTMIDFGFNINTLRHSNKTLLDIFSKQLQDPETENIKNGLKKSIDYLKSKGAKTYAELTAAEKGLGQ